MLRHKQLSNILLRGGFHCKPSIPRTKYLLGKNDYQIFTLQRFLFSTGNHDESSETQNTSQYQQSSQQRDQDQNQQNKTAKTMDQIFQEKLGATKAQLIDKWLEIVSGQFNDKKQGQIQSEETSYKKKISLHEFQKSLEQKQQTISIENKQIFNRDSEQKRNDQDQQKVSSLQWNLKDKQNTEKPQDSSQNIQGFTFTKSQTSSQKHPEYNIPTQHKDVEKARESLNEQIQKILNKRHKQEEFTQQSIFNREKLKNLEKITDQKQLDAAFTTTEQEAKVSMIHNPFKFNIEAFKKNISQRNVFMNMRPIKPQNDDQTMVEEVFALTQPQLEKKFDYFINQNNDMIMSEMNLQKSDLTKNIGLIQRKTILNLYQIKSNLVLNPNPSIEQSNKNLINFASENFDLLNNQSKEFLKDHIKDLIEKKKYIEDIKTALPALKLAHQLELDNLDKLRQQLEQSINVRGIAMDNLEQGVEIARIINFILKIDIKQTQFRVIGPLSEEKLKLTFSNLIKKIISKKNLQTIPFFDKIALLRVIPKAEEGNAQAQNQLFLVLNDILALGNEDQWGILDKENIFLIVDKAHELLQFRDLQNKLKSHLLNIQTSDFGISDMLKLCKKLSEGEKEGQLDIKIVVNMLMRRNIKTVNFIPSTTEFEKYIEFFDYIYKHCPLAYAYLPVDLKYTFYRIKELSKNYLFDLKDIVKFNSILVPSIYQPTLFPNQIILDQIETVNDNGEQLLIEQSFKDLDGTVSNELYSMVDEMLRRIDHTDYSFEHIIQNSSSKFHQLFKPFDERTILIFRKIINDLLKESADKVNKQELKILSRIFANEVVAKKIFDDSQKAIEITENMISIIGNHAKRELNALKTQNLIFEQITDYDLKRDQFLALHNLLSQIDDQQLITKAYQLLPDMFLSLNQLVLLDQNLKLDSLLKLSNSIIQLTSLIKDITQSKFFKRELNHRYSEQLDSMKEIIQSVIEYHYEGTKPLHLSQGKFSQSPQISKKILEDTNRSLINSNINSVISFLNHVTLDHGKTLALKVIEKMTNSRSIVGQDLLNLYKMVEKYGIYEQSKEVIINTAANLLTIGHVPIYIQKKEADPKFQELNQRSEEKTQEIKKNIIKKFLQLNHQEQESLTDKESATLNPLSKIISDVFDQYKDEDIVVSIQSNNNQQTFFQMLGSNKVQNYHEEFIKKIYEKYSNQNIIDQMAENNQKFFIKFAKAWPQFLKNNAIINQVLSSKNNITLPKQQSEIIQILTQQNVINYELMEQHFNTFIKLKDKDSVAALLKQYLHSCATLGFSKFDVQKCIQIFRRIHGTPEQVPEISQILDLLIVLALSDGYYRDFDEKSVIFIDSCLDLIEKNYSGIETLEITRKNPITNEDEKIEMKYYKSIPSLDKVYNKVQLKRHEQNEQFDIEAATKVYEKMIAENFETASELKAQKKANRSKQRKIIDDEIKKKEENSQSELTQEQKENEENLSQDTKSTSLFYALNLDKVEVDEKEKKLITITDENEKIIRDIFDSDDEVDFDEEPEMIYKIMKKLNDLDMTPQEFLNMYQEDPEGVFDSINQINEEKNNDDDQDDDLSGVQDIEKEQEHERLQKIQSQNDNRRINIYDRKASESLYSEEYEFLQYRKKKLQDFDKKQKHLMIYSNINQTNYTDINKSDIVKAWAVLFNFRNKSFDSILYDEFESISVRNAIGKSKGHEHFSQFYLKMVEKSYDVGFKMQIGQKCEKSGWPIDILMSHRKGGPEGKQDNLALFFMLQEEVCFNTKEQKDEPRGVQKLMLKHMKNISSNNYIIVSENLFYKDKNFHEDFFNEVILGFMGWQYKNAQLHLQTEGPHQL